MEIGRLNRPESLFELALRELRNAIIDGRLKLGDQLSEIRLSKMLGISKTPVREALQELRREGLVQIDPQRGTSIFRIDDADIDQIDEFRAMLEISAARTILAGDRTAVSRRIRAVVDGMQKALTRSDIKGYRLLDADLHLALIEGCGNRFVSDAYMLISAKIGALRTRAHDDRTVVDRSLKVHAQLCDLFERGEVDKFCALLDIHIHNTGRDYRAWLAKQTHLADTSGDPVGSLIGGSPKRKPLRHAVAITSALGRTES